MAAPSIGASKLWASPNSAISVLPVVLNVAAARMRIDAFTQSANISATVESIVANFSASRFSGRLSP